MNIDIIKKINGTYEKNIRDAYLSEMVMQYNEANNNVISEFDVLINSVKAQNVNINGTPKKILFKYINDKNTSEYNFKIKIKSYHNDVKCGDYIEYTNNKLKIKDVYIVLSKPESKSSYDVNYGTYCNRNLRWRDIGGKVMEYPCNISNNSYGSKTNLSNDFIAEIDTRSKIKLQDNPITRTIKPNMRFVFNGKKTDIFKVTDIDTAITGGVITLIAKKDEYVQEDDLVNNLAYNDYSDTVHIPPVDTNIEYKIIGDDNVKLNQTAKFTLANYKDGMNIDFRLDDTKIANMISQGQGECFIKGLKVDEYITLTVYKDGVQIAEKLISINR